MSSRATRAADAFRRGDFATAAQEAQAALRAGPDARALLVLARIALERRTHADAVRLARAAVAADGADAACHAQLAYALLSIRDVAGARAAVQAATELASDDVEALDLLGVTCHQLGDYAAGARFLTRAAGLAPDNAVLNTNLGSLLTICGDLEGARHAYRRAIAADPGAPRALAALSEIRTADADDNNVAAIRAAIPRAASPIERLVLHHALSRELDGLGDVAASVAALRSGKAAFRQALPRPLHDDRAMFAALAQLHARGGPGAGHDDPRPIFVTGMPRSGTTLVERLLSNADGVHTVGESAVLPALVRQASGSRSAHIADAAALAARWDTIDGAALGRAYVAQQPPDARAAARFVDKLPLNILLLDVIARVLPRARIVCVLRDPFDTAIGNYRQMFEFGSGSYDYSLDEAATAEQIVGIRAIIDRAVRTWPGQVTCVSLDALIADPAATGRTLVEALDLPWHDAMLHTDANRAPAGSASAAQVRAPIHGGHRDRARAYRAHFPQIARLLAEQGLA